MDDTTNLPVVIFENDGGSFEVTVDQNQETVWLTQLQISNLFEIDQSVVSRHISNIFKDQEIDQERNMQKMHNANSDKPVSSYSLDVILSVGYRTTKSSKAIRFRRWASDILKDYLFKGYALNQNFLLAKQNQIDEIQKTLDFLVKNGKSLESSDQFLNILNQYTNSLIILNQYDENRINIVQGADGVKVEIQEFRALIQKTKQKLTQSKEATNLFGKEYAGKFDGTIGAVYQAYGGSDVYKSLEEKAANLLYLVIKNHAFIDGNKRIGSILFVYFLAKNSFLIRQNGESKITENSLVALALLIAQSRPEDKEILIKLVIRLIQ